MKKVITSFAIMKMPEGNRLVATYSTIDDKGEYVEQNQRFSKIAVNEDVIDAIKTIDDFLTASIPE